MTTRAPLESRLLAFPAIAALLVSACGASPGPGTPLYGNGESGVFRFFTFQCQAEVGTPNPFWVSLDVTDGSTSCSGGLPVCILYCDPEPEQSNCSLTSYPVALQPVSALCEDDACDVVYQPNSDPDDGSVNWIVTLKAATAQLHVEAQGIDPVTGALTVWKDGLSIDSRVTPSWPGCDY